jgi:2-polyprenyl-3-methyl-5-hydroxy-6-metoxy-1,4-benzoquinol methylase
MRDFVEFYSKEYDEDSRFQRHATEFVSTTYILDKLIAMSSHILDIGAGTGAYSLYYAKKDCSVVAIDAVPKYIETLKRKIQLQGSLDIKAYVADISNPSVPLGTNYDVILFMGPIYHLPLPEIKHCIDYCLRLLKMNGLFAVSYVNNHEGPQDSKYSDVFIPYKPIEIEELLSERISMIFHGPTDGEVFGELNNLSQGLLEEIPTLHAWLDKHQSVFQDSRWPLTSIHGLYVGRKTP